MLNEARGQAPAAGTRSGLPVLANGQRRLSVRASAVRLSPEQARTISFVPVICRRANCWPKNVVEGRS